MLSENRDKLDRLAEALLDRETLDAREIESAIEGVPLPPRERVQIPTWADKRQQRDKDKKRSASIFGAPKPATSG